MSSSSWYGTLELPISGLDLRARVISTLNGAKNCPSWWAIVVNMSLGLLRSALYREQKKVAARVFFALQVSAIVYAIVVLPVR
jgi:hypothetical protein